jgi:hypothetical protein
MEHNPIEDDLTMVREIIRIVNDSSHSPETRIVIEEDVFMALCRIMATPHSLHLEFLPVHQQCAFRHCRTGRIIMPVQWTNATESSRIPRMKCGIFISRRMSHGN